MSSRKPWNISLGSHPHRQQLDQYPFVLLIQRLSRNSTSPSMCSKFLSAILIKPISFQTTVFVTSGAALSILDWWQNTTQRPRSYNSCVNSDDIVLLLFFKQPQFQVILSFIHIYLYIFLAHSTQKKYLHCKVFRLRNTPTPPHAFTIFCSHVKYMVMPSNTCYHITFQTSPPLNNLHLFMSHSSQELNNLMLTSRVS